MFEFLKQLKNNRPMRVVVNGNPALRRRSEPIDQITEEVRDLAKQLTRSLVEGVTPGVGLAAPQIGVNVRMIVVDTRLDEEPQDDALPGELVLMQKMPVVLINPELIPYGDETATESEGCLSLPGITGNVTRPKTVVLRARLLDGQTFSATCGGLLARCLQHEADHLDGILFYDRLPEADRKRFRKQMDQLEKRELSLLRIDAAK